MNKTPLTIYRPSSSSEGYLDDKGRWVYDPQEVEIPIRCSLQPYTREGEDKVYLPEGVKEEDSRFVFTKTPILGADDRTKRKPDETVIEGVRYQCVRVRNYTGFGLKTDHYEAVFVRTDKL